MRTTGVGREWLLEFEEEITEGVVMTELAVIELEVVTELEEKEGEVVAEGM